MSWLKNVFNKEEEKHDVLLVKGITDGRFFKLRLGARVTIDTLPLKVAGSALLSPLPVPNQEVEAVGVLDLGDDSVMYRYYLTEDAFIQVNTTNDEVVECKLFTYVDSITPDNRRDFQTFVESGSRIGMPTFEQEGQVFNRVWGSHPNQWTPPVCLDEKVTKKDSNYELRLYTMLYEREVSSAQRMEYGLITAEDSGPDEFVVSIAVGIDITEADLDVV